MLEGVFILKRPQIKFLSDIIIQNVIHIAVRLHQGIHHIVALVLNLSRLLNK